MQGGERLVQKGPQKGFCGFLDSRSPVSPIVCVVGKKVFGAVAAGGAASTSAEEDGAVIAPDTAVDAAAGVGAGDPNDTGPVVDAGTAVFGTGTAVDTVTAAVETGTAAFDTGSAVGTGGAVAGAVGEQGD